MLVLSRKENDSIIIDGDIKITIVKLDRNAVRIGIDAPNDVKILRGELIANSKPAAQGTRTETESVAEFAV